MFWYICILITLLALGIFSYFVRINGKSFQKHVFLICCALLLFFAAMRSVRVGADTYQYQWVFNWIKELPYSKIPTAQGDLWYANGQELFYKFYNKTLSLFNQNAQTITIANSVLLLFLVAKLILHNSKDYWMSIFLFFTLGFYQTALNLTPSSIASYLCMNALYFAEHKKPVPFFAIVGIAALFHNSAIVFFPIYFLLKIPITPKRFWSTIILSAVVCIFFYKQLIHLFPLFLPQKYLTYLETSSVLREQLLVWMSHMILFLYCWFISNRPDKGSIKPSNAAFVFILLETIFYCLGIHLAIFSRAAFLFSPFLIISIPRMLADIPPDRSSNSSSSYLRSNSQSRRISSAGIAKISVIGISIFLYLARISVNNIGTTMPYQFFWSV